MSRFRLSSYAQTEPDTPSDKGDRDKQSFYIVLDLGQPLLSRLLDAALFQSGSKCLLPFGYYSHTENIIRVLFIAGLPFLDYIVLEG